MGGSDLQRAKRLHSRKKYTEVIRILEPKVFQYRQNNDFYYLLGSSYLHTGDIAGAYTYIKRVLDIEKEHIPAMLQLALIELLKGKNAEAIEIWLRILEIDPGNRFAKRGLNLLKQGSLNQDVVDRFLATKKRFSLISEKMSVWPIVLPLIIIVFIALPVVLTLFTEVDIIPDNLNIRNEEVAGISVEPIETLVSTEGKFTYILTEDEIVEMLEEAKEKFNTFEDNAVQQIVNIIKYSNASEEVKQKALLIENYLTTPDFIDFHGNITYREVREEPLRYENCYIRWKGKISNLDINPDRIRFDFLVGYHDNKVLEGIIPVIFDFAVSLEEENPIEIIGQIRDPLTELKIRGTSVRPIAPGGG